MLDKIKNQDKTNWSEEEWKEYAKELKYILGILENIAAMKEYKKAA